MPKTLDAQFSELAEHARDNARLARAAELRALGTRRTRRQAHVTPAMVAALVESRLSPTQIDALANSKLSAAQIAAIQQAKFSAVQLKAVAAYLYRIKALAG
jgi:hypothetical protein